MKITGKRSLSSRLWLNRQLHDPYVKRAHEEGYRSRAAYKLIEIDEKFHLIKKAKCIIDLGAAPGGWSQYLSEKSDVMAKIAAIDLLRFAPIEKVQQFIGDFEEQSNQNAIVEYLGQKADLIVSDMAPATLGCPQTDHLRIMRLVQSAYQFAENMLTNNGAFVAKIFQGGTEKDFVDQLKKSFRHVQFFKPKASRSLSVEIYVIATGFTSCK